MNRDDLEAFSIWLGGARPFLSLGVLVALLAWEGFSPFFHFLRGRERLRHGGLNVLMGLINALVTGVAFVGLWWLTARWAERAGFGLLHLVELPFWLRLIVACLFFDAWMYIWHRLNHRLPFLWRFHRMHHSDPRMDVTTANRFHFGEIILSSLLRVPVIALLGMRMHELAIYEVLMFAVVQFHHANVALPERADRLLRAFIVTPFMHKVHHSRWQPETDSNYSSLLSVWDRLFGSFRLNPEPSSLKFGLDEFSDPSHHTAGGLLGTPWAAPGADRGGARKRALAIVLPALALVAGGWFLSDALKSPAQRLDETRDEIAREFPNVRQLSPAELAAWLDDPRRPAPQLLDAREPEEFSVSHLPGAVRVSPDASAEELLKAIDSSRPVVVYCSVGYRSSRVARRLREAGVDGVANLDGSIFAWANEGRPLVRGGKPATTVHPYNTRAAGMLDPDRRADPPQE